MDDHGGHVLRTGSRTAIEELVQELRSFYKLPAYRYKMEFDHDDAWSGRPGRRSLMSAAKMKYRTDKSTEIGVLVGDFPTHDDPEIQKVLKRLRFAQPDCMDDQKLASEGRKVAATMAGWRSKIEATPNPEESKRRGPMGRPLSPRIRCCRTNIYRPKGWITW